jgi:hypothetical protein
MLLTIHKKDVQSSLFYYATPSAGHNKNIIFIIFKFCDKSVHVPNIFR